MAMYKEVKFLFNEKDTYIMCAGDGGSSALEAIFNCASIKFAFPSDIPPDTYIPEEKVKSLLKHLMTAAFKGIVDCKGSKYDQNVVKNEHKVLVDLIQSFGPSTHMAPCLTSIASFEKSDIIGLTKLLTIHIVHAWVVSPVEKIIYESVRHFSFEKLKLYHDLIQGEAPKQEIALIQCLLDSGKKQLTTHGYNCLHELMEDKFVAVLYWGNKFHVIHKMYGNLLLLETNIDILEKYPTVVWRVFEEVEKEIIYLTSEYVPAIDQPNFAAAKEWYCQKIPKVFGELSSEKAVKDSHRVIPSSGQLSKSQRKRQNKKKKSDENQNQREDHQAEGSLQQKLSQVSVEDSDDKIVKASDETSIGQQLSKKQQKYHKKNTNAEDLASECLKFFREFQDGGSKPYFQGIVQAIKYTGSPNVYVPYDSIMRCNKSLAYTIIDNYPSISGDLTQSLNQYLMEHGVQTDAKLHILHVPEPKSVQSFMSFIEHMDFCEDYDVFGDGVHQSPSYLSRKMALGYLNCIVKKFRDGHCFAGKWSELDMMVRGSGSIFVIEGCEDEDLTPDAGYLDLKKFEAVVLECFKNKDGKFPPYFKELREDFSLIHKCIKDPNKWERFLLLISHPFALKAPMVRSAFLWNVYRAAESQCSGQRHIYAPLHIRTDLTDWRINATQHWLLKKAYDHKNFNNGPYTYEYTITKWQVSHWSLLKYSINAITHVLRYATIINKGQQIHDLTEVDILLGHQLGEFISQLIRFLILNCDMNGLFSSSWRHFIESDCSDKPLQNIANVEATTTEEELVSSTSPGKLVTHETGYAAYYEVQRSSTAGGSHSFVFLGDLDLTDFMNLLTQHGLKVESVCTEGGGTWLRCGSIHIDKTYRKIPVKVDGKAANPCVTVKGPLNDDYLKITGLLSVWFCI